MRKENENRGECIKIGVAALKEHFEKAPVRGNRADGEICVSSGSCGAVVEGRKCNYGYDMYRNVRAGKVVSVRVDESKEPCRKGNSI